MLHKRIFTVTSFLILIITNIHSQWFQQQTNTNCFISKIRMLNENTGYAIGDSSLVLKTTNGGTNWVMLNTGTTADDFFNGIYFLNPDTGWICGGYMGGLGTSKIIRTTNGGNNWNIQYSVTGTYFFAVWMVNNNTGFAGGYDGIYLRTSDAGNSWNGYTVTGADIWTMYFLNAQTGFIAGNSGMIRKTTDGGLTYSLMNSGTNLRIASIFFTDSNYGYAVCDSETVLRTTNEGINWLSQRLGTYIGYESVFFVNHNTGYAVGNWWDIATYKLIKTTNAGVNWSTVSQGNGNPYFDIFFANENTGWIAGYDGLILKTTNAGSTYINNNQTNIPEEIELLQNYPNPFNSQTKICFRINSDLTDKTVTLKVHDITGKEITTLISKNLRQGTYHIPFSANTCSGSSIPSGIYFYTLKSGTAVLTKRMVLIK